jgi:hypothetical protein
MVLTSLGNSAGRIAVVVSRQLQRRGAGPLADPVETERSSDA